MKFNRLSLYGALLLSSVSTVALAQTAAPAPAAKPVVELEQIVVQARRTDESLQTVPVAVTALSGAALTRSGIQTPQDLNLKVPSLTVSTAQSRRTASTFGIRGQRNIQVRLGTDASVAVYFADVVLARPYGINQSLYDMQSVQVLKGPQGTLFGRNTPGGAILFQPKKPTSEVDGFAEGELGNLNHRSATGMVNIPLGDMLSVRVAGNIHKRDGFTTNIVDGKKFDNQDNHSYRVSVLFNPSDKLQNYFVYDAFKADEAATSNVARYVTVSAVPPLPGLLAQIQAEVAAQQARGPRLAAMDAGAATVSQVDNWGISNSTTYQLTDNITLKNIAGVRKVKTLDQFDLDGTRLQLVQVGGKIDIDQVSDEFQIQGKAFDGNLDYILGAFYFRESGLDLNFNVKSLGYLPDAATGNPFSSGGDLSSVSKSLFGQVNYKFSGIEGLSTTLGLRKTWDERDVDVSQASQFRQGTPFAFCRFNNTAQNTNPTCAPKGVNHREFSKLSWTAGLNYQHDRTLYYGKVSRGYRSGGFDPSASTTAMLVGFEPEVVTEGEVGLKSDFNVSTLPVRIATAAYYSKGDNIQRTVRLSQFTTATTTINAGAAHFYGFELESTILPFPGFELTGFYNYNRAIYDTFRDGAGQDLSSNFFTSQPRTKYGVSGTYTRDLEGLGEFSLYATYAFQSRIYFDDLNRSAGIQNGTTQDGYGVLNGGATLKRVAGSAVDASVWVHNVADELYATNGTTLLGVTAVNWSEPRTYGLTLRYSFGASAR